MIAKRISEQTSGIFRRVDSSKAVPRFSVMNYNVQAIVLSAHYAASKRKLSVGIQPERVPEYRQLHVHRLSLSVRTGVGCIFSTHAIWHLPVVFLAYLPIPKPSNHVFDFSGNCSRLSPSVFAPSGVCCHFARKRENSPALLCISSLSIVPCSFRLA